MRTRNTPLAAAWLAGLAGALTLSFAPGAGAVQITNLTVAFDPGNTPDLFDDVGSVASQISSTVGVLSSSATGFVTRYQAGVYTDAGGAGATSNVITLNAAYTISFDIIDAVGSNWQLDIATSRVGARTSVTDGGGQSAFSLGAATGLLGGAGTLGSGSLDLAAIARSQQGNGVNLAFNQTGTATVTGSGNGSVTLSFAFTATAETLVAGTAGDEAAIRMGIPENLSSFTAGAYPGAGGRTAANDGHFVDLDLLDLGPIPEPDTALLLAFGLLALGAGRARERRTRRD
jgi:hypothetical protein